ncbi:hypothetical protein BDN67DRAFT_915333, partial [Paxillus ammoniavirescens]
MSVSTKLGDDFLHIPKLATDGENWVMYKECLQWSIDTRGLVGHLDGTETMPVNPTTLVGRGESWTPGMADKLLEVEGYRKALKEWRIGEAVVKQQIAGTIPATLFLQVKSLATANGIFTYLAKLFEQWSRIVSVEILRKMQALRCNKKGNVWEHFDKLCTLHEQLASMGQAPTDESFTMIIIGSLPTSYDPQISAITALAKISSAMLTSDALIEAIQDNYDHHAAKTKKSANDTEDAAYAA